MSCLSVFDSVLQELRDGHRQRCGDIRTECTALAVTLNVHAFGSEGRSKIAHKTDDPIDDFGECNIARTAGCQEIVDDRNGSDPHFRFGEHILRLVPSRTTAL